MPHFQRIKRVWIIDQEALLWPAEAFNLFFFTEDKEIVAELFPFGEKNTVTSHQMTTIFKKAIMNVNTEGLLQVANLVTRGTDLSLNFARKYLNLKEPAQIWKKIF